MLYVGHLMQRADSMEKTLMLGKIEGKRRGQQKGHWSLGVHGALTEDSLWATGPHAGVQEQQGGLTEITEAEVREQRL